MASKGKSIDERIQDQLDQLENPYLSEADIEKVKRKIKVLESMK